MPIWRMALAMALCTIRDRRTCRRGFNLTGRKARVTTDCIYKYQYSCRYTQAMADVGKTLSALARRSVSCALMSDLLMRASSLAIMGVRLRVRHQNYFTSSRPIVLNGIA